MYKRLFTSYCQGAICQICAAGSQIYGERGARSRSGAMPQWGPWAKILVKGSEANEILATTTPYFALKSVYITRKIVNRVIEISLRLCIT